MKVAVVGSRDLEVDLGKYVPSNTTCIITGGARGVDSVAEAYAERNHVPKLVIKPEYKRYGKQAPLVRNKKIVELADVVVAFWDGRSSGTEHAVEYAKELGKRVVVHRVSSTCV